MRPRYGSYETSPAFHRPDLSGEGTLVDSYGHGTVMGGIIAGNGHDSFDAAGGPHTGMAPDTTLISVKVAGRNGATDVSTVLEAMHWVSAYKNQFNIRVMNLSWGTASTQDPKVDPLNYAVERLCLLEGEHRALQLRRKLLHVRRLLRYGGLQLGDLLLDEVGLVRGDVRLAIRECRLRRRNDIAFRCIPRRRSSNTATPQSMNARPYMVGSTPCELRSKSRTPSVCSRSEIVLETTG